MSMPTALCLTIACISLAGAITFHWLDKNSAPVADGGGRLSISDETKLGFPESVYQPSLVLIEDSWAKPGFRIVIKGSGLELVKTEAGWALRRSDGGTEVLE